MNKSATWWIKRIQEAYDANDARAAYLYDAVSAMLDRLEAGDKSITIVQLDSLVSRIHNA